MLFFFSPFHRISNFRVKRQKLKKSHNFALKWRKEIVQQFLRDHCKEETFILENVYRFGHEKIFPTFSENKNKKISRLVHDMKTSFKKETNVELAKWKLHISKFNWIDLFLLQSYNSSKRRQFFVVHPSVYPPRAEEKYQREINRLRNLRDVVTKASAMENKRLRSQIYIFKQETFVRSTIRRRSSSWFIAFSFAVNARTVNNVTYVQHVRCHFAACAASCGGCEAREQLMRWRGPTAITPLVVIEIFRSRANCKPANHEIIRTDGSIRSPIGHGNQIARDKSPYLVFLLLSNHYIASLPRLYRIIPLDFGPEIKLRSETVKCESRN